MKKPELPLPGLLCAAAFILLVPLAVVLLALFNQRKTDALSWLVSGLVIAASVCSGFLFLGKEEKISRDAAPRRRRS